MSSDLCEECGGTIEYVPAALSSMCVSCGIMSNPNQYVLVDDQTDYAMAGTTWCPSTRHIPGSSNALDSKEKRHLRNKMAARNFTRSMLHGMQHEDIFDRVFALFETSMEKGKFQWGSRATTIIGACIMITIRENGIVACAVIITALEGQSRSAAPCLPQLADILAQPFGVQGSTTLERYVEIQELLANWKLGLPWLSEGIPPETGGKGKARAKRKASAPLREEHAALIQDIVTFREELCRKANEERAGGIPTSQRRATLQIEAASDDDGESDIDVLPEADNKYAGQALELAGSTTSMPLASTSAYPTSTLNSAPDNSYTRSAAPTSSFNPSPSLVGHRAKRRCVREEAPLSTKDTMNKSRNNPPIACLRPAYARRPTKRQNRDAQIVKAASTLLGCDSQTTRRSTIERPRGPDYREVRRHVLLTGINGVADNVRIPGRLESLSALVGEANISDEQLFIDGELDSYIRTPDEVELALKRWEILGLDQALVEVEQTPSAMTPEQARKKMDATALEHALANIGEYYSGGSSSSPSEEELGEGQDNHPGIDSSNASEFGTDGREEILFDLGSSTTPGDQTSRWDFSRTIESIFPGNLGGWTLASKCLYWSEDEILGGGYIDYRALWIRGRSPASGRSNDPNSPRVRRSRLICVGIVRIRLTSINDVGGSTGVLAIDESQGPGKAVRQGLPRVSRNEEVEALQTLSLTRTALKSGQAELRHGSLAICGVVFDRRRDWRARDVIATEHGKRAVDWVTKQIPDQICGTDYVAQGVPTYFGSLNSFDPFALHPFTAGGSSQPTPIPRPPLTSSPYNQALQHQKQNPSSSRRGDPTTPPSGYVPAPPFAQQQQQQSQGIFTNYKADGRRTPDLSDILVKKGSRWPIDAARK
ncbi:hypothetical protein FRB99_005960 [Tulasnella sp. 403]|nr:hypothetical protein FRB99_005960 [Tulasnella sp. 403]